MQLLVWGVAPFKTFDQETDDINQAFRSLYYTGSALCIFFPCFTHLCLPFIYVFLLHISGHPKVSHFTSLSFSNQNVSSGKVSVNNLWQISLDLHRHRQERILNVLLFWNTINDVYTLIFYERLNVTRVTLFKYIHTIERKGADAFFVCWLICKMSHQEPKTTRKYFNLQISKRGNSSHQQFPEQTSSAVVTSNLFVVWYLSLCNKCHLIHGSFSGNQGDLHTEHTHSIPIRDLREIETY